VIPRAQFLDAVLACIGTPVAHMGRVPGGGLDCVGLLWAACRACGLDLPPTQSYGVLPSESQLTAGLLAYCDRCDDLAAAHAWQVMAGRQARHIVVPVGVNGYGQAEVVHAWGKHSKVRRAVLTDHVAAGWRIRGVE
jgi:cell wall-associated NlpC family hydrolase